ncbi:MAG: hypothetical protein ACI9O4_002509, partial [Chitinophagales bacterium]
MNKIILPLKSIITLAPNVHFLRSLFFFFFIILTSSLHAYTWQLTAVTTSYNECTGQATISLPIYYGGDFMISGNYLMKWPNLTPSSQYFTYAHASGPNSSCNSEGYASVSNNSSYPAQYAVTWTKNYPPPCAGTQILDVHVELENRELAYSDIILNFNGTFDDDYDDEHVIGGDLPALTIPSVPVPSSLVASTNDCNYVNLTWSKPTLTSPCLGSIAKFYLYHGTTYIGKTNYLSTASFSTTSGTTTPSNYTVKLVYEYSPTRKKYGGLSSPALGNKKSLPVAPVNFQVSDDNCDTKIDLSWDWSASTPSSFKVYRTASPGQIASVSGSLRNYTDTSVTRGLNYTYFVRAENNCGLGPYSDQATGISPSSPSKPADFNATIVTGIGIELTWPVTSSATSYQIERSLLGGGGSSFLDPTPPNGTSYLDESLVECQTYEYRLKAFNHCEPAGVQSDSIVSTSLVPDLSSTFNVASNPFQTSKGYFSDRVELAWTVANNQNFINQYKIYRKVLGSPDDSIILETVNSGSYIHNDFLASAGVLYKYTIVGETQCEAATIYSNPVSSIGFRSPFGTVTGQVIYTGGIAVKNVKISGSSSSGAAGNSIAFDGASSLRVNHNAGLNTSNGLSVELWMKPSSHTGNFTLAEKLGSYSLKHIGSQYVFTVISQAGTTQTVSVSDAIIGLNNYNQLSASLYQDTLRLFVNGNVASFAFFAASTLQNNSSPVILGSNYQGLMDEFRFCRIGKSVQAIEKDFSRQLNGGEAGLSIYLKMNEGTGDFAYDFSR